MIRSPRSYASLAAAGALVLGGAVIASAAPGANLDLASEEVENEVVADVPADELTLLEEITDTEAEGVDPDDGDLDDRDLGDLGDGDLDDGGEPSEFAAWVQSIPSDWGCVKGRVISAHAAGDKADFEGPEYADITEAVADLELEGRCVDVALARNGAEADDEGDAGVDTQQAPDEAGPPANAGPPADAGPPAETGPAARGDAGPPADRGGPPADRGGPRGGGPGGR